MRWTSRATSAKCELCRHGYDLKKEWTAFYSYGHVLVGWCRACGRTEEVKRDE